jgi:ADP-ribosylglycohydrolase
MIGAIAGDMIGAPYEFHPIKTTGFPLFTSDSGFTDDTVMTVAVAKSILTGTGYAAGMRAFGRRYPNAGYGGRFAGWLLEPDSPAYNSWGNGSAMRVSPVGFAYNTVDRVLAEAERSAVVSHDHPEGVKGAQATALAVFMARTGADKPGIRSEIVARFGYDLDRTVDQIRPTYCFNESCQQTVPEAIVAFLESEGYEHAVRLAVSLGGDSDTLACITGAIAEAFYGVPEEIRQAARARLTSDLLEVVNAFETAYPLIRMV